ncbi:MAG: MFS transporter [Gammaproteobacteria bacterium]|nr:MAG: MFS transporter [Gammaproteobacteria bacterium]
MLRPLAAFYFFYFAALGALLPYWGPYLAARGFDGPEIGLLLGVLAATKVFAPYLWGRLADANGRRLALVRLASWATGGCFLLVPWVQGTAAMALVTAAFGFFWNAALPQVEAATLSLLGRRAPHYGRIRVWGTLGFIAAVWGVGPLLDRHGMHALPTVVLALFAGMALAASAVPDAGEVPGRVRPRPLGPVLRRRAVQALLAAAFLMQLSFGAYYGFFSLHAQAQGLSHSLVGLLWALGAVAEVGVFLVAPRLLAAWPARRWLVLCFAVTVLRWTVIAALPPVWWWWVQPLHALGFGLFHAVMIGAVHRLFPPGCQGRGQALYSATSFGAGGALGAYGAGWLWAAGGGAAAFGAAAVLAAAGALLLRGVKTS